MTAEARTDDKKKKANPPDRTRESIETIVFVVVLVLLLKLFVTEAFVIPTGSMAETLYGYQKIITCPKCGYKYPVNSNDEEEGAVDQVGGRHAAFLTGATCPNCRYPVHFHKEFDSQGNLVAVDSPRTRTGDRVLVLKPVYHWKEPTRGDVVVFKYPQNPQERFIAQNYIKRAMGFGGETIAIFNGDLYVTRELQYPADAISPEGSHLYPRPLDPLDLWRTEYMYRNNAQAAELFEKSQAQGFPEGQGGFEIIRKGVDQLLADRRIVWDNDKQPNELAGKAKPRWYAVSGSESQWKGDKPELPTFFTHSGDDLGWIRYRHLIFPWDNPEKANETPPTHIDNMLGYNSEVSQYRAAGSKENSPRSGNEDEKEWVGDLIVECEAVLGEGSEVVLELSKGLNRFQATFSGGQVKLTSTGPGAKEFGSRPCKVKGPGTYQLRFANVDARLHVWVDNRHIDFGTDADYLPGSTLPNGPKSPGWTNENDIDAPASIGARGTATVKAIKLHRDIFYTKGPYEGSIYYVQPGHYMCMGDNSAQSSDSRMWGAVPERLMLGKAVFVFWPGLPPTRIGFIK